MTRSASNVFHSTPMFDEVEIVREKPQTNEPLDRCFACGRVIPEHTGCTCDRCSKELAQDESWGKVERKGDSK